MGNEKYRKFSSEQVTKATFVAINSVREERELELHIFMGIFLMFPERILNFLLQGNIFCPKDFPARIDFGNLKRFGFFCGMREEKFGQIKKRL